MHRLRCKILHAARYYESAAGLSRRLHGSAPRLGYIRQRASRSTRLIVVTLIITQAGRDRVDGGRQYQFLACADAADITRDASHGAPSARDTW